MNKLVMVLGVAAVATLVGCKDANYKPMASSSKHEAKVIEPATCKCAPGTIHTEPCACGADDCLCVIDVKPASCTCAPGTKHEAPCACGLADCKCIVEKKSVTPPAPAEVTTVYTVRSGDYLAKISKKFNVTISSIKRLNNLTSDTLYIGQKLKLPGKIDIPPAPVAAKTADGKKGYQSYKGATKEYVVKSGDTLGAIAYGNGCNIRQLKEMNGLTSDVLKAGQKLKVPANGKAPEKKVETQKINEAQSKVGPVDTIAPDKKSEEVVEPTPEAVEPPAPVVEEPATSTYVVQEGDDMTGVSIRFCISAAAIRELNNLPDDAQLTPGQVIKLPADAQQ